MNLSHPVRLSRATAILLALLFTIAGTAAGYLLLPARDQRADAAMPDVASPAPAPAADASASPGAQGAGDAVVSIAPEVAQRAGIVVERVKHGRASATLRIPGTVEPNAYRQVIVTPVAGGRVTRVAVELGERVRRGQPMTSIYSPELADAQSRLIALRAELQASEQEVARTRRLVEIGAASRQELEQVEAAHAGRAAAADGARTRLVLLGMPPEAIERLTAGSAVSATIDVPAPLDGVVTERTANVGLNVDPSTPLFTVVDLGSVWIVGDLLERDLPRVDVGSAVTVTTTAAPDRVYQGKISYIDPQVNPATRTARVRVEVGNRDRQLRLGMLAAISLSAAPGAPMVLVPREAVQTIGDRHVVYVAAPGAAGRYVERAVRPGNTVGEQVEILEGLGDGESIVTTGSFYLRAERERLGPQVERAPPASVRVVVGAQGFQPARVDLPAGQRTEITFLRTTDQTCATEVLFADLQLRQPLPLGEPVTVELPPQDGGQLTFTCGMEMLEGAAIFTR